jgi:hypothetical protein
MEPDRNCHAVWRLTEACCSTRAQVQDSFVVES